MSDDRMGEEGGRGGGRRGEKVGAGMGPAALKYLLSKEEERCEEGWRKKMKPSVKKQVGVMKEDNKSFLLGHVGQDIAHQSSWPVSTIGMTTQGFVCVCEHVCVCMCFYTSPYSFFLFLCNNMMVSHAVVCLKTVTCACTHALAFVFTCMSILRGEART